jgi:glycosyltransferase involved in cell wall biosynthesis
MSALRSLSSASLEARRLRLLHVTTVHAPFDTRVFAKEARSLAGAGHDVTLATTLAAREQRNGVRLLPLGAYGGSRFNRVLRGLRAFRTMMTERYDVAHLHDPELLVVAAIPMLLGRRVVYDVHEFYRDEIKVKLWLHPLIRHAASFTYVVLESLALRRLAGIVVVSHVMRARYAGRLPDEHIAVVRNFPSITEDDRSEALARPPQCSRPYVVHTGGASRIRAFDLLVAAAERLRIRGVRAPIACIGEIDLAGYPDPEKLLRRASDADVILPGRVPYVEALRWTAHARVGYLPLEPSTNNALGLPNKIFEYFAFGLPVVATSLGGPVDDAVQDGGGTLVPPRDPERHAAALERYLVDDAAHSVAAVRSAAAGRLTTFEGELAALERLYAHITEES